MEENNEHTNKVRDQFSFGNVGSTESIRRMLGQKVNEE